MTVLLLALTMVLDMDCEIFDKESTPERDTTTIVCGADAHMVREIEQNKIILYPVITDIRYFGEGTDDE